MPTGGLTQGAAHKRRQERTEIDADIKDRIGAVAARIATRIEAADLGRDIRLEAAAAENKRKQREQKQPLARHHEMAERHQHRADDDGAALAEHTVGKEAAENRGEIDEPGIKAPDLRRQRLDIERAEHAFQRAMQARKSDHTSGMI